MMKKCNQLFDHNGSALNAVETDMRLSQLTVQNCTREEGINRKSKEKNKKRHLKLSKQFKRRPSRTSALQACNTRQRHNWKSVKVLADRCKVLPKWTNRKKSSKGQY